MQFINTILFLAAAVSVTALPQNEQTHRDGHLTTKGAAAQCGNGQVLSCCNKGSDSSDGSVLGSLGTNLIGGNCDQVPVNIIGANGILMQACQSNNAACCTGDENSLANVSCDPITA